MKVLWTTVLENQTGIEYGYRVHSTKLALALEALGVTVQRDQTDPDWDFAFHMNGPHMLRPIHSRRNVWFTQTEFEDVTRPVDKAILKQAELMVVPFENSKRVMGKYFPAERIHFVPHGVDEKKFPFFQREQPTGNKVFRFLSCGAIGKRKGSALCVHAFRAWAKSGTMPENVELRIKTTEAFGVAPGVVQYFALFPGTAGNDDMAGPFSEPCPLPRIVMDNRVLSEDDLSWLYRNAHCFLFPSYGEGGGLTLLEAMARGLPSIWTHYSAMRSYTDETTGFPVDKFKIVPIKRDDGGICHGAEIDQGAFIDRMREVYSRYPAALVRGQTASEKIHREYKWSDAAAKLKAIFEQHMGCQ